MSDQAPLPGMPPRAVRTVVTRWKCPHCPTSRARRAAAEAHIDRCWHNPANRGCRSCAHFVRADGESCDCRSDCTLSDSWPDHCALGRELPDERPITGCPLWEHRDAKRTNP